MRMAEDALPSAERDNGLMVANAFELSMHVPLCELGLGWAGATIAMYIFAMFPCATLPMNFHLP